MQEARRTMRRAVARAVDATTSIAARLRPRAAERTPSERNVLDDIATRRPWNVRVKAARLRARVRRGSDEGVTVIVVNWNTKDVTADVVRAVQRRSPSGVRVLVVDNGSTDGSAELFGQWPGIETMRLGSNAGHGVALDLAVLATRTSVAVTLDSDAIPLTDDWLDQIVEPVRSGRAVLAGQRSRRDFVHPIYAAIDTATFAKRRLSWQVHRRHPEGEADRWGENAWDTGELLTAQLAPHEVVFIERTENAVEGLPGMTAGGAVYHHGGVSRSADGVVTPEAYRGWRDACAALGVPPEPGRPHAEVES